MTFDSTMDLDEEKSSVTANDQIEVKETFDPFEEIYYDQEKAIENEITLNQPLVSEKISTDVLSTEYAFDDRIYQEKVIELSKKYPFLRRTRRDGNCFYRAFAFGYLEENLQRVTELDRFRHLTADLRDQLEKLGYSNFTLEDIRDVVIALIDQVRNEPNEKKLLEIFSCRPSFDYFVAYLRLFVSAHLQVNAEFFENFIDERRTVKQFCDTEVEPMGRESDNIHIIALTKAAAVPLRVIYMDRNEKSIFTVHDFPARDDENNSSEFQPMITMLYRPGHYDLLYEH